MPFSPLLLQILPQSTMAKWNMIPSAEGPFSGLDAMARYCFGLLYDRYRLSLRSVGEYHSEKFLGARVVKLSKLNPRKFAGDERTTTTYETYCVYKQKDLAALMGCTERTVRRCMETLRDAGVIETERAGFNGANRFYIPSQIQAYFSTDEAMAASDRK